MIEAAALTADDASAGDGDPASERVWADALTAAALLALDPSGCGGLRLRAGPGPARDSWMTYLSALIPAGTPVRRMPSGIGDERLLGGLDLAATLKAGRPIAMRGMLAEADGGLLIAAMAERLGGETAAKLSLALDRGAVRPERTGAAEEVSTRFGLILLDEGIEEEEAPPEALIDRLAFSIDLSAYRGPLETDGFPLPEEIEAARERLSAASVGDEAMRALVGAALALGVASARAPILALRVARAAAALDGRPEASMDDCALAARLVLAPRATRLPAPPEDQQEEEPEDRQEEEPPEPPEDPDQDPPSEEPEPPPDESEAKTPEEILVEAAQAALPRDLLERMRAGVKLRSPASAGRKGEIARSLTRGRPIGVRPGAPRPGQRLNVVETLRNAAPWQPLRRRERGEETGEAATRVEVRKDDFRITRFKRARETCTVFVVDASGSSAFNRLAEAKGAVELLLAECYSRRDQVALITFAGKTVDLALPPTRSLARAKKLLAGLPGGGGTPLAAAIDAAGELAGKLARAGRTPAIVLMTDGRANIARDGAGDPPRAAEESLSAARSFAAQGHAALLVDISPRPRENAQALAGALKARYLPLPRADARRLNDAVRGATGR
ncbi:MAG: magnesium chelatase subunit D [Marivibrio sp.]|uniref:magnesium chelatase subunit D n=1 Tax=Marivibrio sp. TaxID=2039719 RepID=UPI0032EFF65A